MSRIEPHFDRQPYDRRFAINRRSSNDPDYFNGARPDRRRDGGERRLSGENRWDWDRVSDWSSLLQMEV